MNVNVNKWAPRAIALAAVGFFVWPSAMQLLDRPEPKPPAKTTKLAKSLLQPKMLPAPKKDPFRLPAVKPEMLAKNKNKAHARINGVLASQSGIGIAGRGGIATAANPTPGLNLEGTCILGNCRMAIINGRLYAPKETVTGGDGSANDYKLVDIFPYKVLLECEGKKVELTYSDAITARRDSGNPLARPVQDVFPRGNGQRFGAGR